MVFGCYLFVISDDQLPCPFRNLRAEVVYDGGSYMSPSIARKIVNAYAPKRNKSVLLTPRQKEIVTGIVDGKSYKMIANDLFVSLDTVRSHIKNIYKALEINSKAELIKKSYDNEI